MNHTFGRISSVGTGRPPVHVRAGDVHMDRAGRRGDR